MLIELGFLKKPLTNWHGFLVMLGRETGCCYFIKLWAYRVQGLNT